MQASAPSAGSRDRTARRGHPAPADDRPAEAAGELAVLAPDEAHKLTAEIRALAERRSDGDEGGDAGGDAGGDRPRCTGGGRGGRARCARRAR